MNKKESVFWFIASNVVEEHLGFLSDDKFDLLVKDVAEAMATVALDGAHDSKVYEEAEEFLKEQE